MPLLFEQQLRVPGRIGSVSHVDASPEAEEREAAEERHNQKHRDASLNRLFDAEVDGSGRAGCEQDSQVEPIAGSFGAFEVHGG